ncbi:hypothetical protein [Nocardia sp. BMG51109]|uniref:hypothetical protein n=1 Tax=Nocardia sp. BMG51109 TaxID=1056816 RepID=UPI000466EAB2|nr:hypothetical protein [Nocardia sp. BMG51109]
MGTGPITEWVGKMKKTLIAAFALIAVATAHVLGAGSARAVSGSESVTCSGSVKPWGWFSAQTYQYASLDSDGDVSNESHTLNFSGFLEGAEDAQLLHATGDKWLMYRAGDFDIAVPFEDDAGLFVVDNRYRETKWVKLCDN